MSSALHRLLAQCPVPVLLISRSPTAVSIEPPIRRIVVPSLGTRTGRAAQDIAFALAARFDAEAHAIHVVATPAPDGVSLATPGLFASGDEMLAGSAVIAASFGRTATLHRAHGTMPGMELVRHAVRVDADMLVAGVDPYRSGDRAVLGYDAAYVLGHVRQTVALIILPH